MVGVSASRLLLASTASPRAPMYAWDWADTRYYQGPANAGTPVIGTARVVVYVAAVPDAVGRELVCHASSGNYGWRVFTGYPGAGSLGALAGGSGGSVLSPTYTIAAGDVGRLMVVHVVVDTVCRLYVGGAEVGTGSAAVTITDPGADARLTLGRYQHAGGYGGCPLGVVELRVSPTAMSAAAVAADAAAVMARTRGLRLPPLPGETTRHLASDVATASDWHDRIGDNLTLTQSGAVQVSEVP